MDNEQLSACLEQALAGDKEALGMFLGTVQEDVFNLALRMLGTVTDAEDATQEIMIRVMTESSFLQRRRCVCYLGISHRGQSFTQLPQGAVCSRGIQLGNVW